MTTRTLGSLNVTAISNKYKAHAFSTIYLVTNYADQSIEQQGLISDINTTKVKEL
ncbi:MAG: hypothetical protein M3297_12740 [Thermoproteota archaeon]|nr:hypothetical protein [Thermoproteota archaeon]